MKQKTWFPAQLLFGILTGLLLPVELMAFFWDMPNVFLYVPLFTVPLYLLFSAPAYFPGKKAIGLCCRRRLSASCSPQAGRRSAGPLAGFFSS